MATKQLYATGRFKYANRMMQAGDPVEMSGPHTRLYTALGKVSTERPKVARAPKAEAPEAPAKPKAARKPRKKAAKKTA